MREEGFHCLCEFTRCGNGGNLEARQTGVVEEEKDKKGGELREFKRLNLFISGEVQLDIGGSGGEGGSESGGGAGYGFFEN